MFAACNSIQVCFHFNAACIRLVSIVCTAQYFHLITFPPFPPTPPTLPVPQLHALEVKRGLHVTPIQRCPNRRVIVMVVLRRDEVPSRLDIAVTAPLLVAPRVTILIRLLEHRNCAVHMLLIDLSHCL